MLRGIDIHKIPLGEKEELRVEMRQFKGRAFVEFRVYAHAHAEEAKWPTGKGFLVPASRLPELRKAFTDLSAVSSETAGNT